MHMASPQHNHYQAQKCSALLGSKEPKRCRTIVQLNQGWQFSQADDPDGVYRETQGFPTEIHLDLLHNGLIPHPFLGKHENDVQWVGEKPWTYMTSFRLANGSFHDASQTADMIFEGLDTYATVVLNGNTILRCDNMFLPSRVEVTDSLLCTEINILEITFDSAYLIGKQIVKRTPITSGAAGMATQVDWRFEKLNIIMAGIGVLHYSHLAHRNLYTWRYIKQEYQIFLFARLLASH